MTFSTVLYDLDCILYRCDLCVNREDGKRAGEDKKAKENDHLEHYFNFIGIPNARLSLLVDFSHKKFEKLL